MNFCGDCGTKLVGGACASCTAKSTSGLSAESLEKSLSALESLSKGVRPAEAKSNEGDNRKAKDMNDAAVDETHDRGKVGEGDSEEEPKTARDIEGKAKGKPKGTSFGTGKVGKGGFVPPDEEEFEDPREREEEEEEEEQQGGGRGAAPMPFKSASKKKAKKSFADDLLEHDDVRKAVDVSDFLEGLVYEFSEYTDSLRDDVAKSLAFAGYQQKFNIGLAKALGEIGEFVKSLKAEVAVIAKSPAGTRKSDTSAAAIEKSFDGGNATKNELTKSQKATKLAALMEAGDTSIQPLDVVRAEMEGFVKPEHQAKLGIENKQ